MLDIALQSSCLALDTDIHDMCLSSFQRPCITHSTSTLKPLFGRFLSYLGAYSGHEVLI